MRKENTRRETGNEKKQKKKNLFMKLTREESKKEIFWQEQVKGRRLTRVERRKIIETKARKAKAKVFMTIGLFAFGTMTGATTQNLLTEKNEAKKTEISVDAEKYTDSINITNVTNDRNIFINGLRVELDEAGAKEELEQGVIEEINSLKNSNEVLDYIKQIYADEYNQKNGENIGIDDIHFWKDRLADLYIDTAENGDTIVRKGNKSKGKTKVSSDRGLMEAYVQDENGFHMEMSVYDFSKYYNVYNEGEIVEQGDNNVLTDIGGVIENGIDYYSGFVDEEESHIYKERLINSVIQYKQAKIKEIVNPRIQEGKTDEGMENEQ